MGSFSGGLEAAGNLEGIVDPPLETSEGTNHDDTGTETVPETRESNSGVNLAGGTTLLVHDGDHGVSGVRDDSAEDTSPVTGQEGDHKLEVLGVRLTGSSEDVSVKESHGLLESDELDNGVGDLSAPEGDDTLVEAVPALGLHDLGPALTEGKGEGAGLGGLDSDFDLQTRLINNLFQGGSQLIPVVVEELYLQIRRVRGRYRR